MKNILRSSVMFAAFVSAALLPCAGQSSGAGKAAVSAPGSFDLGVTYTAKVAKISNLSSSNFVLQGGSVDGVYWLNPGKVRMHNLGMAFDFSGETKSNIAPGLSLHQFSLVGGPRYTLWHAKSKAGANFYGQALVGFVHASHSYFPVPPNSTKASATSFALQTGGGLNLPIGGNLGWRVAEVDYIMTRLPNNADTYQGDMRFSTGITYHFGK